MKNLPLRLAALLLIPCLTVDPALATALSQPQIQIGRFATIQTPLFSEQALSAADQEFIESLIPNWLEYRRRSQLGHQVIDMMRIPGTGGTHFGHVPLIAGGSGERKKSRFQPNIDDFLISIMSPRNVSKADEQAFLGMWKALLEQILSTTRQGSSISFKSLDDGAQIELIGPSDGSLDDEIERISLIARDLQITSTDVSLPGQPRRFYLLPGTRPFDMEVQQAAKIRSARSDDSGITGPPEKGSSGIKTMIFTAIVIGAATLGLMEWAPPLFAQWHIPSWLTFAGIAVMIGAVIGPGGSGEESIRSAMQTVLTNDEFDINRHRLLYGYRNESIHTNWITDPDEAFTTSDPILWKRTINDLDELRPYLQRLNHIAQKHFQPSLLNAVSSDDGAVKLRPRGMGPLAASLMSNSGVGVQLGNGLVRRIDAIGREIRITFGSFYDDMGGFSDNDMILVFSEDQSHIVEVRQKKYVVAATLAGAPTKIWDAAIRLDDNGPKLLVIVDDENVESLQKTMKKGLPIDFMGIKQVQKEWKKYESLFDFEPVLADAATGEKSSEQGSSGIKTMMFSAAVIGAATYGLMYLAPQLFAQWHIPSWLAFASIGVMIGAVIGPGGSGQDETKAKKPMEDRQLRWVLLQMVHAKNLSAQEQFDVVYRFLLKQRPNLAAQLETVRHLIPVQVLQPLGKVMDLPVSMSDKQLLSLAFDQSLIYAEVQKPSSRLVKWGDILFDLSFMAQQGKPIRPSLATKIVGHHSLPSFLGDDIQGMGTHDLYYLLTGSYEVRETSAPLLYVLLPFGERLFSILQRRLKENAPLDDQLILTELMTSNIPMHAEPEGPLFRVVENKDVLGFISRAKEISGLTQKPGGSAVTRNPAEEGISVMESAIVFALVSVLLLGVSVLLAPQLWARWTQIPAWHTALAGSLAATLLSAVFGGGKSWGPRTYESPYQLIKALGYLLHEPANGALQVTIKTEFFTLLTIRLRDPDVFGSNDFDVVAQQNDPVYAENDAYDRLRKFLQKSEEKRFKVDLGDYHPHDVQKDHGLRDVTVWVLPDDSHLAPVLPFRKPGPRTLKAVVDPDEKGLSRLESTALILFTMGLFIAGLVILAPQLWTKWMHLYSAISSTIGPWHWHVPLWIKVTGAMTVIGSVIGPGEPSAHNWESLPPLLRESLSRLASIVNEESSAEPNARENAQQIISQLVEEYGNVSSERLEEHIRQLTLALAVVFRPHTVREGALSPDMALASLILGTLKNLIPLVGVLDPQNEPPQHLSWGQVREERTPDGQSSLFYYPSTGINRVGVSIPRLAAVPPSDFVVPLIAAKDRLLAEQLLAAEAIAPQLYKLATFDPNALNQLVAFKPIDSTEAIRRTYPLMWAVAKHLGLVATPSPKRDQSAENLYRRILSDTLWPTTVTREQLAVLGKWYQSHPVPLAVIAFLAAASEPATRGNVLPDELSNEATDQLVYIYLSLTGAERVAMQGYLQALATEILPRPKLSWLQRPLGYFLILQQRLAIYTNPPGTNTLNRGSAASSTEPGIAGAGSAGDTGSGPSITARGGGIGADIYDMPDPVRRLGERRRGELPEPHILISVDKGLPVPNESGGGSGKLEPPSQQLIEDVNRLISAMESGDSVEPAIQPYLAGVPAVTESQIREATREIAASYREARNLLSTTAQQQIFDRAFALSVILHADQPRARGDNRPYMVHVAGVVRLLYEDFAVGSEIPDKDELAHVLSAAWLHDTIEDGKKGRWGHARFTALKSDHALRAEIGGIIQQLTDADVLSLVQGLSKPDYEGEENLQKEIKIEAQYYRDLARKRLGTQLIKAADFSFNLMDLKNHPNRAFPAKFFLKRLEPVLGFLEVTQLSETAKRKLVQFIRAAVDENNQINLSLNDTTKVPAVLIPDQETSLIAAEIALQNVERAKRNNSPRIGINGGSGRIGKNLLRAWLQNPKGIEIVALNDVAFNFKKFGTLGLEEFVWQLENEFAIAPRSKVQDLKYTYGRDDDGTYWISIDGKRIVITDEPEPEKIPWSALNVDIVLEATGRFTTGEAAQNHVDRPGGAKKVIITAPATGDVQTIAPGVNSEELDPTRKVYSAASCTTNDIVPPLRILQDVLNVEIFYVPTTHAYTQDQPVLPLLRPEAPQRGLPAGLSIIPTTTGAAKAVGQVIPELLGKGDGVALRVPVPDGSIAPTIIVVSRPTTKEEVNRLLREASEGRMKGIMGYSSRTLNSQYILGRTESSIVDGSLTYVSPNGKFVVVWSWYDNEFGYANRVLDLAKLVGDTLPSELPKDLNAGEAITSKSPDKGSSGIVMALLTSVTIGAVIFGLWLLAPQLFAHWHVPSWLTYGGIATLFGSVMGPRGTVNKRNDFVVRSDERNLKFELWKKRLRQWLVEHADSGGQNKEEMAKRLGISRATIYNRGWSSNFLGKGIGYEIKAKPNRSYSASDFVISAAETNLNYRRYVGRLRTFLTEQARRRYPQVEKAAKALGVRRATFYHWLNSEPSEKPRTPKQTRKISVVLPTMKLKKEFFALLDLQGRQLKTAIIEMIQKEVNEGKQKLSPAIARAAQGKKSSQKGSFAIGMSILSAAAFGGVAAGLSHGYLPLMLKITGLAAVLAILLPHANAVHSTVSPESHLTAIAA